MSHGHQTSDPRYPHRYTGPTVQTKGAPRPLRTGEVCRIVGRRGAAGARRIVTTDGSGWIVGLKQLERA